MKEQGAIGKTGHPRGYLFYQEHGKGKGHLGKWFTEGMAFARNTRLIYPPSPFIALHPCDAQNNRHSLLGGHEDQDDENARRMRYLDESRT